MGEAELDAHLQRRLAACSAFGMRRELESVVCATRGKRQQAARAEAGALLGVRGGVRGYLRISTNGAIGVQVLAEATKEQDDTSLVWMRRYECIEPDSAFMNCWTLVYVILVLYISTIGGRVVSLCSCLHLMRRKHAAADEPGGWLKQSARG